ncbi:MAG: acyl-CoA thioesterase [Gammaproteobacteria bacterium]|nr:acyl-CoA thioesterase [Gammaproteobacteria bacterium]
MTLDEFRARYPFIIHARVEWADMDAFQHVNNTIYFRYFERVRIAYFEQMGIVAHQRTGGFGPILHSTRCRFRAPLTYPDAIEIGTCISELQSDRFSMHYGIYSQGLATLAAEGDCIMVYYDYGKGEKAAIPEEIRVRLAESAREAPGSKTTGQNT